MDRCTAQALPDAGARPGCTIAEDLHRVEDGGEGGDRPAPNGPNGPSARALALCGQVQVLPGATRRSGLGPVLMQGPGGRLLSSDAVHHLTFEPPLPWHRPASVPETHTGASGPGPLKT